MNKAKQHPAGVTGVIVTVAVLVAKQLGVDLSVDAAATVVGALVAIVSVFHPLPAALAPEIDPPAPAPAAPVDPPQ